MSLNSKDKKSSGKKSSGEKSSGTKSNSKKSSSQSTKNPKSNKPRKNKQTILEETVRKIMQSELKLLFPFLLPGVLSKTIPQESGSNKADSVKQAPPSPAKVEVQNNGSSSSKDPDESSVEEEENLDDPMEIDFVKKKEPKTSVATVKCKIRRLKIPAMTLDSGAEPPIITENIVERVGDKIDKSEIHDLSGIATDPVESIGSSATYQLL